MSTPNQEERHAVHIRQVVGMDAAAPLREIGKLSCFAGLRSSLFHPPPTRHKKGVTCSSCIAKTSLYLLEENFPPS